MSIMDEEMKEQLVELGPWVHNFEIEGYHTRDLNPDVRVPGCDATPIDFPEQRWSEIQELLDEDSNTVLELGPGSGYMSLQMDRMGYDVTAVEISEKRYEQAVFVKEYFDADFDIINDDAVDYLSDCESFDIIVASGFIYHVPHLKLTTDRMQHRATRQLILETVCYEEKRGYTDYSPDGEEWSFSCDEMYKQLSLWPGELEEINGKGRYTRRLFVKRYG